MSLWGRIALGLEEQGGAALVSITAVAGSTPREAGARMVVLPEGSIAGTIGGGALEFEMLQRAAALLAIRKPASERHRQALGPDLGQCCGGQASILIETFDRNDMPWIRPLVLAETRGTIETFGTLDSFGRLHRRLGGPSEAGGRAGEVHETFGVKLTPLLLFGAGHVGRAVVVALAPLPFEIDWVDPRAESFPSHAPGNVRMRCASDPVNVLKDAWEGSFVAVMTHSHPLDLAIVAAALPDARFPYVGLIGSETKRARFTSQLKAAQVNGSALSRLVCPIGGKLLADKAPPVIAAAIAVELLAARERYALPR